MNVTVAGPEDISAMKLVAVTDRGTKKDFIDLYCLANKLFTMEEMFELYEKKYHLLSQNKLTLLKSLQFFEDADRSEMPQMIEKVSWNDIKKFFRKEVLRLWDEYSK